MAHAVIHGCIMCIRDVALLAWLLVDASGMRTASAQRPALHPLYCSNQTFEAVRRRSEAFLGAPGRQEQQTWRCRWNVLVDQPSPFLGSNKTKRSKIRRTLQMRQRKTSTTGITTGIKWKKNRRTSQVRQRETPTTGITTGIEQK